MHVQIDQESHVEHLAQSAAMAVADLHEAVRLATSRRELTVLRTVAAGLVAQAEQVERAARLRDEWFDEPRSSR